MVTAQERNLEESDDEELLQAASAERRLMLTNDQDFLRIHAEWLASSRSYSGIVYWRQDLPIGEAVRRIISYALNNSAEQAANVVKFL